MKNRLGKTTVAGVALAALLLFALAGTGAANPPVSQDKPVKATGDAKPPKIVHMVEPVYPEDARKQGIEGKVILEATADIKGKVQGVKVLRGVDGLNQAAMDAVKQWTYEPMMINGKPMPVVFTVTVQFRLKDKGPKTGAESGAASDAKGAAEGKEPKILKKIDPVFPEESIRELLKPRRVLRSRPLPVLPSAGMEDRNGLRDLSASAASLGMGRELLAAGNDIAGTVFTNGAIVTLRAFSIAEGQITPNLKVRRASVEAAFAADLEALHQAIADGPHAPTARLRESGTLILSA